ncbi:16S rRNA (uracil(1498)-N(3))-methyltransferase [Planctomonas psychrotolerans]|uniref:16S rRNA (uracil(1498)-N(3))-methyltransferase n=1 Tax=Planctomonas psychrotolerans TaxID=2528712 RepID=UPI001238CA1E|nr:16S rRNA (uracil(1498)-N(3))-methyltransferase [Planctomonas psychrotolerans]
MAHFYLAAPSSAAEPAGGDWAAGSRVELSGAEAKHAVTVSRVRVGDRLMVGDGAGTIATGAVAEATGSRLVLEVEHVRRVPEPARRILLAQALAKGDRDELAVQAATELGVDGVMPWSAARSVSRWQGDKVAKGRERWSSIVREASKQSIRARVPVVADLVDTRGLAALAPSTTMLVLDPEADLRIADVPLDGGADIVLVVGPEGGLTPGETETLRTAGATPIRLGTEVLRTSTAGPAALAVLNVALRRW